MPAVAVLTIKFLRIRAKSFFCIFAAFRRHIIRHWAKLLRHLLKRRAILRP